MLDTEDPIRHEKVKIMNEIKKEWLIDRAEYMFAEIEDEINRLQMQIERDTASVKRMEDEFSASEEDFYIAAIDAGLDEREAGMQRDDLYAAHINDQTLVNLKQCIEYNKRRAVALKQDREIYLFYLKQNEEEQ